MALTQDDFYGTYGTYQEARSKLAERMTDAWADMRLSTRRLLNEQPSEARLLFYVLLSDMIFFLSWSVRTLVSPSAGSTSAVPVEIGFWLVVALLMRTSAMYVLSMVAGSVLRICGGRGSWRETRTAVFWGALVAAPFGFLLALVSVAFRMLAPSAAVFGEDLVALLPYWISIVPFVWFISAGLAEVHGFRNTTTVFLYMTVAGLAAVILGMSVIVRLV